MKLLKLLKLFLKKIIFYYGWKIEKIYVQKEANKTSPNKKELLTLANCSGVFHLGAHRGSEASVYEWFGKKVIWVEANPKIHFDLKINIKKYINQISYCNLITDKIGKEYKFNISNNDSASSSIFQFGELSVGKKNLWPQKKALKFIDSIILYSTTIDNFVYKNSINIKGYNHWVLDLQGSELLALKGAHNSLQYCKSIMIEVSEGEVYKNSPQYKEILKFLKTYDFKPATKIISQHCNLLFIKN